MICFAIYYQFAIKLHVYISSIKFDYFAISQYRDLHLREIHMVEKMAMTRNDELKLRMSIDRIQTGSKQIIYTTSLHFARMTGLHFDWLIDWLSGDLRPVENISINKNWSILGPYNSYFLLTTTCFIPSWIMMNGMRVSSHNGKYSGHLKLSSLHIKWELAVVIFGVRRVRLKIYM